MTAEILTEDMLRDALKQLVPEIVSTHPEFGELLAQSMSRTCSLLPDLVRAERYHELGTLLIELGGLYQAEAAMLRTVPADAEPSPGNVDGATLLQAITDSDPAVMDELLANHQWTRVPNKTAGSSWPTIQRAPQDDVLSTSHSAP